MINGGRFKILWFKRLYLLLSKNEREEIYKKDDRINRVRKDEKKKEIDAMMEQFTRTRMMTLKRNYKKELLWKRK